MKGKNTHQRLGIERAKQEGKYKGKSPIKINEDEFMLICERWRNKEITATQAMNKLGLKPNTFYRRVAQLGA